MSQASPSPAPPQSLEQLLRMGADAARAGNRQAARALFLALSREHPADARVWIGLAGVAASRNEQREALERVVALDPGNERARRALARLTAAEAAPAGAVTAVLPETIAVPQAGLATVVPAEIEEEPPRAPFPLLNLIAMGLILLLLVAVGVVLGRALLGGDEGTAEVPQATPELILQPTPAGGQAASSSAEAVATAAGGSAPAQTSAPAVADQAGTAASATALPATAAPASSPGIAPSPPLAATAPAQGPTPAPGQALTLPMGTPIDHDGWTAVLVSPDYVLPLEGAIGDLRPSGRFVLAVVAVSNNSPSPRVIPPDMFVLVDGAGQTYLPVPGASTAYLTLYQRAQRGDLALEDTFDPVVGLRSVPIIFDVPPGASGLRLTVNGAGPAGWPVGDTPPPSAPSGP